MTPNEKEGASSLAKGCVVVGAIGVLLGVVTLMAGAMYLLAAQSDAEDVINELRASGLPTSLAELNDWYEEPAVGENAATYYIEAADLMVLGDKSPENWPAGTQAPEGAMVSVDVYLAANAPAIAKAREAMAFPSARYPFDYTLYRTDPSAVNIDWMSQVRAITRLLVMEATAHVEHGNAAGAVESLQNAFHASQSLRDAPTLIASLVNQAVFYIVLESVGRVLSEVDLSEDQLALLEDAAEAAHNPRSMERAFIGELCLAYDGPAFTDSWFFGADHRRYVTFLSQLIAAGSQSPEEMLSMLEEIESNAADQAFAVIITPISTISAPALMSSTDSFLGSAMRYRAARIVFAIEKYRARHGRLPETLEALIPDFLENVPQTVYGGGPFQYTIQGLGYAVDSPGSAKGRPIVFTVNRTPSNAVATEDTESTEL